MGNINAHAILPPSSAHCWMHCLAAPFMQKNRPNKSSSYADEGSLAHALATTCLETDVMPENFIKQRFRWQHDGVETMPMIEAEMARYVDDYVSSIREAATGKVLYVEQRMDISHITGEPDAAGTGDAVILDGHKIEVHDLKYGMGVIVKARENWQLMIYALAAVDEFAWFADFQEIKVVIHQVRLQDEPEEWTCSRADLEAFRKKVKSRAFLAWDIFNNGFGSRKKEELFAPSEDSCRFCRAAGICEEQTKHAMQAISADFEVIEDAAVIVPKEIAKIEDNKYPVEMLALSAEAIPFLKDYIEAVDKKLNSLLMNGEKVPGWKLVQGRAGNTKWTDEEAVAQALTNWGLSEEEVFDKSVKSPTQIKKKYEKKQAPIWDAVKKLTKRAPGKPNAVPESDERDPYVPPNASEDFEIGEAEDGE